MFQIHIFLVTVIHLVQNINSVFVLTIFTCFFMKCVKKALILLSLFFAVQVLLVMGIFIQFDNLLHLLDFLELLSL